MDRLAELAALLEQARDVIEGRVTTPHPPAWCEARAWSRYLLALDDATLDRCEHAGPASVFVEDDHAPRSLRTIAARSLALSELPPLGRSFKAPTSGANVRKRAQVDALAARVRHFAEGAARIVDVGAGRGLLTRELAEALAVPALGIDRNERLLEFARALADPARVRFAQAELTADALALAREDVGIGLHACGALGDALIDAAARSGCAVLLVPCCAHKIDGTAREPLSDAGRRLGLRFDRATLGLANLATRADGGFDAARGMQRRLRRYALYLLLREAGVELEPGDETEGINRRQMRYELEAIAPRAFARRGLPTPSARAIEDAWTRACAEHAIVRRLALPRLIFARPLELALAFDRATRLTETDRAREATVEEAFDNSASPRNVLIARPPR